MSIPARTFISSKNPDRAEGILAVFRGGNAGREYVLVGEEINIGRGEECDIVLVDPNTSRTHARIDNVDGRFSLSDSQSKNGTFVNNNRVEHCFLADGDIINMGETLFRFRIGQTTGNGHRSVKRRMLNPVDPSASSASSAFHAALISKKVWQPPKFTAVKSLGAMLLKSTVQLSKQLAPLWSKLKREKFYSQKLRNLNLKQFSIIGLCLVAAILLLNGGKKKSTVQNDKAPITTSVASSKAAATTEPLIAPATLSATEVYSHKSLARERYSQAIQAMNGTDFKRAMSLFEEVIALDKDHPAAAQKLKLAKLSLEQLIEDSYNSGLREFAKLYYERSIHEWEKVAALSSGFSESYFEKANQKIAEAKTKLEETR